MKIFAAAIYLLVFAVPEVCAQSETPKFEIGAQFTALRLKEVEILDARIIHGFGGRFTYNITDHIAAEAEGNYFLKDDYFGGRRVTQGSFGVKAGVRRRRVGVFGKARPGFIRFKERLFCLIPEGCLSAPPQRFISRSQFALDLGGVVEFYPSRRVSLRTDVGDTIVRFHQGTGSIDGRPRSLHYTSHNLQFSAGVGFRF